jgi:phage terminase large subunit-like protein
MMLAITTAGKDQFSLCFQFHTYVEKILEGTVEDDTFFGVIYGLDEEDIEDWENEANWIKANPNLGVSKSWKGMRDQARQVKEMPEGLSNFMRLHLSVWVDTDSRWISTELWNKCGDIRFDVADLAGRTCFGGLDLSTTTDMSAWVLVFPPDDLFSDVYIVLPRFFVPRDNMIERIRKDRVPFDVWVRDGYVQATDGNVIDYDHIIKQIEADAELYDLQEIAFDRWGSQTIVNTLTRKGLSVVQFGQGYASMSGPMKELGNLIRGKRLGHGNNPPLTWCATNVVAETDAAENIKPSKNRSRERIDGITGTIMGLGRAMANMEEESVYKTRGLRVV